jgi:hypothetical protein
MRPGNPPIPPRAIALANKCAFTRAHQNPHAAHGWDQERTSFSEEKEAKRLLLLWFMGAMMPTPQTKSQRSFLVLFFKKEPLALPCLNGAA